MSKLLKKNQFSDRELYALWLDLDSTVEIGLDAVNDLKDQITSMRKQIKRTMKKRSQAAEMYKEITGRMPTWKRK